MFFFEEECQALKTLPTKLKMGTKNEQPLASIDKEKKEKYSKKTNSRAPQRKNRKSYPDKSNKPGEQEEQMLEICKENGSKIKNLLNE